MGELWEAGGSEEEIEYQLLSWAAAATLSPTDRVEALMMRSTSERIAFSLDALREQQAFLSDFTEVLQRSRRNS